MEKYSRLLLAIFAAALLVAFIAGISWFASIGSFRTTEFLPLLALSYAAGLTMIIMPCTLPLIFLIVPMTMGKAYGKGLLMSLLFGLGLTITITFYGAATAGLGQVIGVGRSQTVIILIAGFTAYLFGLSELRILKLTIPSIQGIPGFVYKQGDYSKSFLLGLVLGNAGVGCPNPLFYVLLLYIVGTGNVATGALVGFVHGLGRATPLIMLAILGVLGIQAAKGLVEKASVIQGFVSYSLIFLGAYLLTTAIFGIGWWNFEIPNYIAWVALVVFIILPGVGKRLLPKRAETE